MYPALRRTVRRIGVRSARFPLGVDFGENEYGGKTSALVVKLRTIDWHVPVLYPVGQATLLTDVRVDVTPYPKVTAVGKSDPTLAHVTVTLSQA